MKIWRLILGAVCLCLLAGCGPARGNGGAISPVEKGAAALEGDGVSPGSAVSLAEDETPAYLTCRIVDGAEEGELLLAALDGALYGGCEGFHDGRSVYRLTLAENTPVLLDGEPAGAGDLQDGMPLEISFNGNILETFPAQLGEVYEVRGFSIGTRQNPGGSEYDLCGLYLQVLDDLWNKDPALNENISLAGLDLSRAPGGLLESEKAALAWRFGELHGVEAVTGTFEELAEQGYFESGSLSTPAPEEGEDLGHLWYQWPDGCLFSITPNDGHEGEAYSLPVLFFNAEKWKSPLAAYCLYDCSAVWPAGGTWSGYQIGSEMIS